MCWVNWNNGVGEVNLVSIAIVLQRLTMSWVGYQLITLVLVVSNGILGVIVRTLALVTREVVGLQGVASDIVNVVNR